LKPSNIFLVHQPDGTRIVKLLDFGLAREVEPSDEGPSTAPGIIIGTPEYMSPEQVRSSKVGPRADLYSVGVITFQMLTGKRPYRAEKADDVIDMVLDAPVPRVSSFQPRVHPKFDELVFRLMKKRPDERPATAEEIVKELSSIKRVVEATESGAQSTDAAMAMTEVVSAMAGIADDDPDDQPKKKRRWPVVVAAALGVVLALGAGAWWLASQQ
jgi:serine/threonine-protein kinase